ncbi:hypothetical protein O181_013249 [Austropuccinia psidii MF-1]|uniref:Uncharacterized protein n=1 Tax=Austropuccinia psidii MF-1 TaxID=1389203 RepID=A0A9Q3BW28_9BASI|nr:hypothetical protein [Austropuccinia psidii MF-1]
MPLVCPRIGLAPHINPYLLVSTNGSVLISSYTHVVPIPSCGPPKRANGQQVDLHNQLPLSLNFQTYASYDKALRRHADLGASRNSNPNG